MSKKTLLLILFLFAVTCGLLYLALVTPPYQQKQHVNGPTPTPLSVNAHTMLSLGPASASQSSQLAQYTLAVTMDTGSNPVNSVQIMRKYESANSDKTASDRWPPHPMDRQFSKQILRRIHT